MSHKPEEPLTALRAALHQTPSSKAFQEILALFDTWHTDDRELGIAYAREHLHSWPTELCTLHAYDLYKLWPEMPENTPKDTFSLLRSIELTYDRLLHEDEWANEFDWLFNDFQRVDIEAMLTSPHAQHIAQFKGTAQYLKHPKDATTPNAPLLPLTHLALRDCKLSHNDIQWLLSSLQAPLTSLDLSGHPLSAKNIQTLCTSPHTQTLEALVLRETALDDMLLKQLTRSPLLSHVKHLDLSHNQLNPNSIRYIANSSYLTAIEQLNLSSCPALTQPITSHLGTEKTHLEQSYETFGMAEKLPIEFRKQQLNQLTKAELDQLAKRHGIGNAPFRGKMELILMLINRK